MENEIGHSILTTIKTYLNLPPEIKDFDKMLISYINDTLSYVTGDLGIGPEEGFRITGYDETWEQFVGEGNYLDVRSLISMRIRLIFDPPQVAAVISAIERQIDEYEWRVTNRKDTEGSWDQLTLF